MVLPGMPNNLEYESMKACIKIESQEKVAIFVALLE